MSVLGGGVLKAEGSDVATDNARIHVEAMGGLERVMRLKSLRTGEQIRTADQELEFQMWAERPNCVRVEI
ncbi:MAG: hypothetical protein J6386_22090 [Candidatus Synoicihabitans palmerolidicus]|nr:hypothetical protein [Candidatus Synoicihabitans palmerolidicus]